MDNLQGIIDPDPFGKRKGELVSKRKEYVARLEKIKVYIFELEKETVDIERKRNDISEKIKTQMTISRESFKELEEIEQQIQKELTKALGVFGIGFADSCIDKNAIKALIDAMNVKYKKMREAEREIFRLIETIDSLFYRENMRNQKIHDLFAERDKAIDDINRIDSALFSKPIVTF